MVIESFKDGWEVFKGDFGPWVATTLVWSLAASVAGSIVPVVGGLVLLPNMIREANSAVEERRSPEVANLFQFDHLGDDLISMLLYAVAQMAGTLLCCIGWPVAWIGFWYSAELAADGRVSPSDTMKVSWMWAKENVWDTVAIALVGLILNGLGASVGLGIGVLVTLPVTVLAWVLYWHRVRDDVYAMAQREGVAVAPRAQGELTMDTPWDGGMAGAPPQTDGHVGVDSEQHS